MSDWETESTEPLPTQLAYPLRAIIRTLVQAAVGVLFAWLARVGVEFVDPNAAVMLVDLLTALVWAGVTALATWVMSWPAVARWLLPPAPPKRSKGAGHEGSEPVL